MLSALLLCALDLALPTLTAPTSHLSKRLAENTPWHLSDLELGPSTFSFHFSDTNTGMLNNLCPPFPPAFPASPPASPLTNKPKPVQRRLLLRNAMEANTKNHRSGTRIRLLSYHTNRKQSKHHRSLYLLRLREPDGLV